METLKEPFSLLIQLWSHDQWERVGVCVCVRAAGGAACFEVDRRSGEIRTTGQPLTPSKEYMLQVQAVDWQSQDGPRATVAVLAGHRAPQFTNATYRLHLPEDASVGQP